MTTVVTPVRPRKSLEPFLKDDVAYHEYQIAGIRRMARMKSFLLADDMGLGKTLQTLTVFCMDVKLGLADTMLVVCPVSLRANWADEIEKFTRLRYVLFGEVSDPRRQGRYKKLSVKARHEQLQEFLSGVGPRILIVNYEQLTSKAHADVFSSYMFDAACFDEAHLIKNPESARAKAALAVKSRRSFMLTGTPMLNQVNELWPILHRIDPVAHPRYYSFVNRHCVFGGYEGRQVVGTKNQAELINYLSKVMIRRLKKDVLTLPDPYIVPVYVGLTDEQRQLYDQYMDDFSEVHGERENPLTRFTRLKQICGTPYLLDPSFPDSSFKLDRAVDIIEETIVNQNEKIVLFTQWRGIIECIVKRLKAKGLLKEFPTYQLHGDIAAHTRVADVKDWASHKGPSTLLCMTQVAGVGLNMVAARTCVFVDKLFVPGLNRQAIDRLHRIGQNQTQAVQVFEVMARGTIEHRIDQILREKAHLFGEIVEGGVGMQRLLHEIKEQLKRDLH